VTCAEEVLEEIGVDCSERSAPQRFQQADAVQTRILGEMGATPVHSDELARRISTMEK
jgi:hypothetical protein